MEIVYGYYGDWNKSQIEIMKEFGIHLELGADSFQIEEGDIHEKIKPLMEQWGFDKDRAVGTFYDKKELDNAKWLVYSGSWTNGYPQPEGDWITSQIITYDTSGNYCNKCGCGLIQKAPFRLRKKPNWKNKHTFELEWIYDEIFVRKETYELIFKPLGIGYWDVLLHRTGEIIDDTVQLKIPISTIPLNLLKQPFEQCTQCGRKKYLNQIEGYFPNFINHQTPKYPIQKSQEYYGSGYAADKWIILTQELRQLMIKHHIRAGYEPLF